MKLYDSQMLMLVYVLLIACLRCSSATRNDVKGQYDIIGVLNDVTSKMNNSLNSHEIGHHFYRQDDPNPVETADEEDFSSPLADHFDFGIDFNSSCYSDLAYTLQNIQNIANPWALQLIDSYGKPESGILQGNLRWLGDYHECVNVYAPPLRNHSDGKITAGNFHGKYCSMQYSIPISKETSLPITSGICIPDSCSATTLTKDFVKLLNIAKAVIPALNGTKSFLNASLTCKPTSKPLNAPAVAMICLMVIFGILVLLGSLISAYEHIFKETRLKQEPTNINSSEMNNDHEVLLRDDVSENERSGIGEKCKLFLKCFCVFTNGSKLLNTDASEGQLLCLHGIRFLSMSWVILCHTFAFCATQISNYKETFTLIDNFAFQIILNGFYSVDSFFVLSGFLLAYLFFKEYSKRKDQMSWVYFYIHRYLRLTPVYMIVLGFYSTIYLYLGSGPFWPDADVDPNCKANWWWNLLYINNLQDTAEQCMAWSWYLANDMQFFVISPLFLILLYRWPKIGFSVVGLGFLITFVANFVITYHFDLMCGLSNIGEAAASQKLFLEKFGKYFEKIYVKPYTRIGPYLIGICLGYLLFKEKENNKPKLSWITLSLGWLTASAVTLTCVYGLYHKTPDTVAASFYNALNRTCFAAGLSWVIYVCLTGQGGFVNSILSYKLFIPLSRLTYCAYLIHPMIITGYFTAMKTLLYFSNETLVIAFLGSLVVSYAFAFLVSLVFESPVIGLEKLIRRQFKS